MERFQGDTIVRRQLPAWEWLYARSFIFRHLMHDVLGYNWLFIRNRDMAVAEERASAALSETLDRFIRLADSTGFKLLLVFHPLVYQARDASYRSMHFARLIAQMRARGVPVVDMLEEYRRAGLTGDAVEPYYWKLDMHHNGPGYALMGEAIAEAISRLGVLPGEEPAGPRLVHGERRQASPLTP
jgi:hypothetical protein